MLRYALRLANGNLEAARDLVQDTFLRLWELDAATASVVRGHLPEWLYTVCRHRAIDLGRKERRMQLVEPETMERAEHDAAATLDGEASTREAASGVMGALGNLPERQQEILRLKFQSGLSYQEIARVMDLSVGNVGFIIHTALKTLRVKLVAAEGGAAEPSPSAPGRGQDEGALGQRAVGT